MNSFSKQFTDSQVEVIVRMRETREIWPVITKLLNKQWGYSYSAKVYEGIHRRFAEKVKPLNAHPHADFTREKLGDILKTNDKKKRRFFITAVGAAAEVHDAGFKAIQSYCKATNTELVLLPMPAHVRALTNQPNHYDPKLKPLLKTNFATEYVFNDNVKALELRLNPQQTQPLTGIQRIRGRDHLTQETGVKHLLKNSKKCSIIVAHSKQMMETLPTGNNSFPRIIHSTGSITRPNYLRNRIGLIAKEDHVLGGLILEINAKEFYITQVQLNETDGSFVDKFGHRYFANGKVQKERAEAFVMGDIHPGYEDQTALDAWKEVWKHIQPKRVFLHDWFDGTSISHHLASKKLEKAKKPKHFKTLQSEIDYAKNLLEEVRQAAPKDCETVLVASNHPEHVSRYLNEGRYMTDCVDNYELGHRMVVDILDGRNPLKARLDPQSKYRWLKANQDYIVEGCQCGSHGHIGTNGSRGSIRQNESIYSSSMTAHTHVPGIFHGAYVVGHTSQDRHGYNDGPSGWLKCSGVIYKGGHKQLIIMVGANWKI